MVLKKVMKILSFIEGMIPVGTQVFIPFGKPGFGFPKLEQGTMCSGIVNIYIKLNYCVILFVLFGF